MAANGVVAHKEIDHIDRIAVDAQGRILVAAGLEVLRVLPDGQLDAGFGEDGAIYLNEGIFGEITITFQQNGFILVGGSTAATTQGKPIRSFIVRVTDTGQIDDSFGENGSIRPEHARILSFAVQADDKIVVVLRQNTRNALARYLPDGKPDPSFGQDGMIVTDFQGHLLDMVSGVSVGENGKILVTGGWWGKPSVTARFLAHGELDAGFGNAGIVVSDTADLTPPAGHLLLPDGKFLLGKTAGPVTERPPLLIRSTDGKIIGQVERTDTDTDVLLIRYERDGSLDSQLVNAD